MVTPSRSPGDLFPFAPDSMGTRRPGCTKPLLLGCGLLAALVVGGLLLLLARAPAILVWTLERIEERLLSAPPADLAPRERERVEAAFAAAVTALRAGKADPAGLHELQSNLLAVSRRPPGGVGRGELLDLAAALERVAGRAPEPAPPAVLEATPEAPAEAAPQAPPAGQDGPLQ